MNYFKFFLFIVITIFFIACSNADKKNEILDEAPYFQATGYAQGTTYNIIYEDQLKRDFSKSFDSILKDFDLQLSVYVDSSVISKVNELAVNQSINLKAAPLFQECFQLAKQVYQKTNQSFNPSIYPLVKYWGFLSFEEEDENHQQSEIDSLLQIIDFSDHSILLSNDIIKKYGNSKFDFNAIAQGFSVDVIARFLNQREIKNYMIEIGGELKTKGQSTKKLPWKIGIDQPLDNSRPGEQEFQLIASISDRSLATSGNYRKFYEKDGVKYSHTINPSTGRPVNHKLLSVTVVTEKCALADAYATAFMVMGTDKTKLFLEDNKDLNLSVYLIYTDSTSEWQTWQTKSFDEFIIK